MKRFKIHIVKFLAIVISVMYILMPIHKEFKSVLHAISHNLDAPSFVLQHDKGANIKYEEQLNSRIQSTRNQRAHNHVILDFIEIIFTSDSNRDKNQKGESLTVDFKINKHIVSDTYSFVNHDIKNIEKPLFGFRSSFFKKEYLAQLYRPPKT